MVAAALTWAGADWLWPALLTLALGLGLLAWAYRPATGGAWRWLCALLKTLGLALLVFCLLEPLWTGQRVRPGANLFLVVADNSEGLQIRDRGESRTRGEQLRHWLDRSAPGWQAQLEDGFDVRRYLFDARLQPTRDFSELSFEGHSSNLGQALRTLAERYRGRPLAGLLLFTDGIATDLKGGLPAFEGLPPVYPVVVGRAEPICDLALRQVHVSQTVFEDAPVTVQAEVGASALRGGEVVARLFDSAGAQAAEERLRVRRDEETLAFRFRLRPDKPGVSFYTLRVATAPEADAAPGQVSQEATLANNQRVVAVDRGRTVPRILYVAGRPNWEYKFLNRALAQDPQVQLVGLVRVARREPKFEFRGRAGETGNPLFRGFGDQSREEVERYDQPVLVRLNTRDEFELRSGFPRTPEDLYGYHAVILDDIEAAFFTPDQAALLQKFVSERGGGLLMLGGMESFQQGQYQRTPIGDLLPVYLDRMEEPAPSAGLRLNLTREGWLQSWARLRDEEGAEQGRIDGMPPFQVVNRVRSVKPGASVIATVADDRRREYPGLVVQRFGRGRSAALLVGDFWRWGMRDAEARRDFDKAWRQCVRWLVADVPNRVELAVEDLPGDPHGAVRLQVRVRDPKFQPVDDAAVTLETRLAAPLGNPPSTNLTRLPAEASADEAGLYETLYIPRAAGGYLATASVTNGVGAELGRAETGWSTDRASEEFRSLAPNVALLETLARQTRGEVIAASRLESFVRDLPRRQAPVMEAWTYPAWHTPALFALALGCLVAEWGIRRWKGLP